MTDNKNDPMHVSRKSIILPIHEGNLGIKIINEDEDRPEYIELYTYFSSFSKIVEKVAFTPQLLRFISHLDLSYNGLTDLPQAFKAFHNLRNLNLSHNNFKMIPQCFYTSGLKDLKTLDLSYNLINDLMAPPTCSKSLKRLCLDNNSLKYLPYWIRNFHLNVLKELSYNNNQSVFNLTDPYQIAKLEKLELRSSCVWDVHLKYLKRFENLRFLDIGNNLYHDSIAFNSFKNLDLIFHQFRWKDLNVLKLNGLGILDLPDGLFWVESLTELELNNNNLTLFPEEGIEHLINLEVLDISCNELSVIPNKLDLLDNLKTLIAHKNCISTIPSVSALPKSLECLDLYDNQIEVIDTELINSDNIKCIDLDYNYATLSEEHSSYKQYCEKRHQLRKKFNMDYQKYDNVKIVKELPIIIDNDRDARRVEESNELIQLFDFADAEEGCDTQWECDSNSDYINSHYTTVDPNLYIDIDEILFEDAD